jgi:hypothetical protein
MGNEIKSSYLKLKEYFSNQALITDLIAKLTITFGIILIVGGLYLMILNPSVSHQITQTNQVAPSKAFSIDWVPGVPFYLGDLNLDAVTFGSVSWILGINLLLVGLGLWVRHRLARLAGILIFTLAAFFQFIQILLFGIMGSPYSVILFTVDALFVYFLFSKFDTQTNCYVNR